MYELQVVNKATNTMKAWGDYQIFYKELIHKLKTSNKKIVITAHPSEIQDEASGLINQAVGVKGSLKGFIEADFNVVVYTRVVSDSTTGKVNYGFYVNKTKETTSWSIKSPFEMFETDILEDNDVMLVFNAIEKFKDE
jgi:hypothetical protein